MLPHFATDSGIGLLIFGFMILVGVFVAAVILWVIGTMLWDIYLWADSRKQATRREPGSIIGKRYKAASSGTRLQSVVTLSSSGQMGTTMAPVSYSAPEKFEVCAKTAAGDFWISVDKASYANLWDGSRVMVVGVTGRMSNKFRPQGIVTAPF